MDSWIAGTDGSTRNHKLGRKRENIQFDIFLMKSTGGNALHR